MMKKWFILCAVLLGVVAAHAQDSEEVYNNNPKPKTEVILPGRGHINVEKLRGPIDLGMDISQLSISELRVLRNAFYARQGRAFEDADLRAIFSTTTWYEDTMFGRWERDELRQSKLVEAYLKRKGKTERTATDADWTEAWKNCGFKSVYPLTRGQQAFVKKLKDREVELLGQNFQTKPGDKVNMANVLNIYQLESVEQPLLEQLGRNGFAIVPAQHSQLFHVYEKNDYSDFPSFVTTDAYLQLFHLYFDTVLRDVEEQHLNSMLTVLCQGMYDHFTQLMQSKKLKKDVAADVAWCQAYYAVALSLLTGTTPAVSTVYEQQVSDELQHVMAAENSSSTFLGPDYYPAPGKVLFAYGLFRPRGHYTRSKRVSSYFRAMMWLQTVPMGTDYPEQMRRAVLMAEAIGGNEQLRQMYLHISEPLTYLMGTPDNVTILQVADEWARMGKSLDNKRALRQLTTVVERIAQRQTRINPAFVHTSRYKVNLMPQRYQPDAEMLSLMTDSKSEVSLRPRPRGLDVMAAMGIGAAERVLRSELKEQEAWPGFDRALAQADSVARQTPWGASVANGWMHVLAVMCHAGDTVRHAALPYFMGSEQWQKKDLNAALASWAELKHDAILYAKQPMEAECGDGGPDAPVVKGYVEPNVAFWEAAENLLRATDKVLTSYGLITEKSVSAMGDMRELAEFLSAMSRKELKGQELSKEEYNQIEIVGSRLENISLNLVRESDQMLMGWSDLTSADKKVAVVADVFTANGDNVPSDKRCVLYEGNGLADEIYVVVPVGRYLYLMRGAVLSYREFTKAVDEPRLTDEEWQEQLKAQPETGRPAWMREIIAPVKALPNDNEEVFYSSGC